jgi:phage terminase large subunit-like protein
MPKLSQNDPPRATRSGNYFDHDAAALIEGFIATLTLTKSTKSGEPEPFTLLPHTRAMIVNAWAWKRPDGNRLYRKVFQTLGRKQAKTQGAAALVVSMFFLDPEPKQEIYFAATDTDQAAICFEAVYDMIVACPDLEALVEITLSQRKIRHKETGSIIRVLSSDGKRKHGYNPSMVVFDELHAWGPAQAELYAALTTGSKSRKQPLRVIITTAGSDQETICYREYEYAKRVLAGEIVDETYLPLIHEVPADADWTDTSLWPKALPLLETGHHSLSDYQEEFNQAMARPDLQNQFRRLYLNQWTSSETQWIPLHEWDACELAEFPDLDGLPCYAALDLARSQDLTALSLVWVDGENHYIRTWYWLPENGIDAKSKRDGIPYAQWAAEGFISLTPGDVTDFAMVEQAIKTLCHTHKVSLLAYDPAFAQELAQRLEKERITLATFKQSPANFTEPCLKVERLIYGRKLWHEVNPVTRWCFDCATVKSTEYGMMRLVKPNRNTNSKRIDGAVAATMAIGIAHNSPTTSIWETRGAPI